MKGDKFFILFDGNLELLHSTRADLDMKIDVWREF